MIDVLLTRDSASHVEQKKQSTKVFFSIQNIRPNMRNKTFQEKYIWHDERIINSASIRKFISYINPPSSWEKHAGQSGYLIL
jgi:hypothetical protein